MNNVVEFDSRREAPRAPEAAINGLIMLCRDLSGVLRRETEKLAAMQTGAVESMQQEKASLAALYDDWARSVMSDETKLKSAAIDPLVAKLEQGAAR